MSTLSLCVIARDEEQSLPRMIESARAAVDEIIVVDTGSSDRTREVASKLGARVVEQAFDDDFSAVRNRSLREATGDWVLVLDADEVLTAESIPVLRAAIEDPHACGYYLPFENLRGGGRVHRCAMLRLFRRHRDVEFENLIHEQVTSSLRRLAERTGRSISVLDGALVRHDGYLPDVYEARGKAERNRRLFRRQVEQNPDHIYSWYKYGDFLRRFDDAKDEALAALHKAAALLRRASASETRELSFSAEVFALLAVEYDKRGDVARAIDLAEEGVRRFDPTPNLLYAYGHLLAKHARHRESLRAFAQLRQFDGKVLANPPEPGVTGPIAYLGMARALAKLNHPRAARRCYELSIELDSGCVAARNELARILLQTGDIAGAVHQYTSIRERDPTNTEAILRLGTLLLHTGDAARAEDELLAALDLGADPRVVGPKLGQTRMSQGDLEGALTVFAETPDQPEARLGIEVLTRLANGEDPLSGPGMTAAQAPVWRGLLRRSGVLAGAMA